MRKVQTRAATAAEEKARADLFTAIQNVRDDISLSYQNEPEIDRAFGVGQRIRSNSTPLLIAAAAGIQQAFEDDALGPKARAAGVTQARIDQLADLRRTLTDMDTAQNVEISSRKSATSEAAAAVRKVKSNTAFMRKAWKRVFRGKPGLLAEIKSTIARRKPRKRPAKGPGKGSAAPGGTAATAKS